MNEYAADPNKFGKEPDPNVSALMGKDFIVDPQLPIFADANFRLGNNAYIAYIPDTKINQTLHWNATVGGIGASGVQFFEDIIVSLEVTNGRISDMETFPISVVNYPVENYPPYIEDVDDQIFYVKGYLKYQFGIKVPSWTCLILSVRS